MHPKFQELLRQHSKIYKVRRHFSSNLERIVDKVMEDTGLDRQTIYHIISSQFLMINDVIYSSNDRTEGKEPKLEDYKSIRLIYLGAFMPSKTKFKKLITDKKTE